MNPPDGDEEAGGPAGLLGVQGQVAQQVVRPPPALGANVGGANFTCALKQQRKWSFGVCELASAANMLNRLHTHAVGGGGDEKVGVETKTRPPDVCTRFWDQPHGSRCSAVS